MAVRIWPPAPHEEGIVAWDEQPDAEELAVWLGEQLHRDVVFGDNTRQQAIAAPEVGRAEV
jgi:hypothetical protein